jgi:hypothetical protein
VGGPSWRLEAHQREDQSVKARGRRLMVKFTSELRGRFLTLLEIGRNVEEACAGAGIGRATVTRCAAAGRVSRAPAEKATLAARFDVIREAAATRCLRRKTSRLLKKAARGGSTQAAMLLMERAWERKGESPSAEALEGDPLAAIDAEVELALRRARERHRP